MVPIHSRIAELVRKNYDHAVELGSDFLLNDPDSPKGGISITYDKYAGRFVKINDVTEKVYTYRDLDWLRKDIEKMS